MLASGLKTNTRELIPTIPHSPYLPHSYNLLWGRKSGEDIERVGIVGISSRVFTVPTVIGDIRDLQSNGLHATVPTICV